MKEDVSVETHVGIETIYDTISNHDTLAEMTPCLKSVKIKSRRPENYLAEEILVLGGREYLCMVRHYCQPPHLHKYTVVGGDAKGSRVIERFEGMSDGTRITAHIHWKTGLRGVLKSRSVANDYANMLQAASPG